MPLTIGTPPAGSGVRLGGPSVIGSAKPPPAPVFTAQPAAFSLYQAGGRVTNAGAAASPVSRWQWQQKQGDGSWQDVPGWTSATLDTTISTTDAPARSGTYRLVAFNGATSSASQEVTLYNVYLRIQNDASATNGSANGTTKSTNFLYLEDGPAGARYYSAFYTLAADDSAFTPPGTSTGRAVATWTSTNTNVVSTSNVSATGQLTASIKAGQADVTAAIGNLSSVLRVNIA